MSNDTAIVKAADYDLDEKKAEEIQVSFAPMIAERKVLAKEYKAIISQDIDADTCKRAGTLRKALVKVRTGISDTHKTQKHLFLQAGRFVDAWKNAETLPVTQMEDKLRGIEEHFENVEKERINKIRVARAEELRKYEVEDVLIPAGLGQMEDAVWTNYLAGVKSAYDQRKAAEAKAEKERIAKEKKEAEERERVRLENEQLRKDAEAARKKEEAAEAKRKAEAEERERLERARLAKEAKERKKIEDAAQKEREAAEAKLEAERKAADAKLKAERDERERLEREKKARDDAERKERDAVEARNKDKAHRQAVDKATAEAMMLIDVSLEYVICDKIVKAIANGEFPNVSVNY